MWGKFYGHTLGNFQDLRRSKGLCLNFVKQQSDDFE